MDALFLYGIKCKIQNNQGKTLNQIVKETFSNKITINLSTLGSNLLEIRIGPLTYIIVKDIAQESLKNIKTMRRLTGGKGKRGKTRKSNSRKSSTRKLRKDNHKKVIVLQKGGNNFKNIIVYLCVFLILHTFFGVNLTGTLPDAQEGEFSLNKVWSDSSVNADEARDLMQDISEITITGTETDISTFMRLTENPPTETNVLALSDQDFLGQQGKSIKSGNKTVISQQLWSNDSPMAKLTDLLNTMKLSPRSRLLHPMSSAQGLSVLLKYHIEETPSGDNNVIIDSILEPTEDSIDDVRFKSMASFLSENQEKRDIVINSAIQQVYTALSNGMLVDKNNGTVMLLLSEFPVHPAPIWDRGVRQDRFHRDGHNFFQPPDFNNTEAENLQASVKGYPCSMCGGVNPYDLIMTMTYDPKTTPYMAKFQSVDEDNDGTVTTIPLEDQADASTLHTTFLNQQGDQYNERGENAIAQHSAVFEYSNIHRRSILGFIARGNWVPRQGVKLRTVWREGTGEPDIEEL